MLTYDFSPLLRTAIGFEHLARQAEAAAHHDEAMSYPPYNIEKFGEDVYRITLAVAGFCEDELTIEHKDNALIVNGQSTKNKDEPSFLHKGIATRDFLHKFELADYVRVTGANLSDGLLSIDLKREIPEEKKPRRIEIKNEAPQSLLGRAKKLIGSSNKDKNKVA